MRLGNNEELIINIWVVSVDKGKLWFLVLSVGSGNRQKQALGVDMYVTCSII